MRTIVVTGAASGIGKACLAALAAQGDRAIGVDVQPAEIEADLRVPAARREAIERIEALADGTIDGIVACAGVAAAEPGEVVAVNYFGAVELIVGLRPALARSPAPRVAAISSLSVCSPFDEALVAACLAGVEQEAQARARAVGPADPLIVYPSTKQALSLWIKREAILPAWLDDGILLNAIAPGVVRTPMMAGVLADPAMVEMLRSEVPFPIGQPSEPEQIAALALFLVGPGNSNMVGQTFFCDGGAEATLRPRRI